MDPKKGRQAEVRGAQRRRKSELEENLEDVCSYFRGWETDAHSGKGASQSHPLLWQLLDKAVGFLFPCIIRVLRDPFRVAINHGGGAGEEWSAASEVAGVQVWGTPKEAPTALDPGNQFQLSPK